VSSALQVLLDVLDLERIEVDIFRGRQPAWDARPALRVFGGQVASQALVAAGRTVDADRPVHSLHAYFLRPGDPDVPIVYQVDRIRDGRSFTTRRVVAVQHGKAIFNLQASFHVAEPGLEHAGVMPSAPDPESLPRSTDLLEPHSERLFPGEKLPRPIDMRYVTDPPPIASQRDEPSPRQSLLWMRADGDMPDDPLLHVCAVTWASDYSLMDAVLVRHQIDASSGIRPVSLDHAMWFHRPFRADEWWLYTQQTPWTGGARGLAHGEIFTRDGQLAVSVVQEGLVRPPSR
jgi:acyl-CoA thioesterase-2